MATQTREPVQITAGDTIAFTKSLDDYPASDGWTLKYVLRGGAEPIEFSSVADGDDHELSVASDVTAAWLPAEYTLTGFAEKGSERHTVYMAALVILPNQESPDAGEQKTHAQRMLEKLEAVLEGKAGDDILDSEIEGTVIRRMPYQDIYRMRMKYKREREDEIAAERIRNGRTSGRKIVTRLNVMQSGNNDPATIFRGTA